MADVAAGGAWRGRDVGAWVVMVHHAGGWLLGVHGGCAVVVLRGRRLHGRMVGRAAVVG